MRRIALLLLVVVAAISACSPSASGAPTSSADPASVPLPSTIQRSAVLALVRGLDQVGRVDRIDAKLMSFEEYVRIAGPVRTHSGDPLTTALTGFGIRGDPSAIYVWAVAVSGAVYPNGRVPVFFGGPPPGSPTPYPPYRWAIFLVDALRGGLMVVGDAGIDQSWPAQFDNLPSHPVAVPTAAASPSSLTWQERLVADAQKVQAQLAFRPLVPTYAPVEVRGQVEKPDGCGVSTSPCLNYRFESPPGTVVLKVLQGPAGCCLDAARPGAVRNIDIRPGVSAQYIPVESQFGGPILWWEEDTARGPVYVALSSPVFSEDELVRIASSMRPLPPTAASTVPTAPPEPAVALTRPLPQSPATPVVVTAVREAGAILGIRASGGAYTYDGQTGTLAFFPAARTPTEHPAPRGSAVAVERLSPTVPGGRFLIAKELAIRDGGVERVVYRTPGDGFYWSGWSPDGRYVALWELDQYSGSVDMDGRPLVIIDVQTGARTDLGRALLSGTTAWTAPHTLAYIAGIGRLVWDSKTLRVWSPEQGVRDVTASDVAAFGPAWSADGRSLYFVSGPAGQWDPLTAVSGRGVGDRRISVYDIATGAIRTLAHEPGYVEEGVSPSRDGARLLVLRRRTAPATDIRAIPAVDLEVWLTDANGGHGTVLVRFPSYGLNAYGYLPGPTEWTWSE